MDTANNNNNLQKEIYEYIVGKVMGSMILEPCAEEPRSEKYGKLMHYSSSVPFLTSEWKIRLNCQRIFTLAVQKEEVQNFGRELVDQGVVEDCLVMQITATSRFGNK
ncbi:hypothetical protein P5673_003644 [Acropora cervicornis]|uniref:Uncharacterized protein n=1 Tax=Acropora cervicornis TaxID=6130 RepID=A0AAD9R0Y3_ACRCE|nr:hypothetical protein P5673_003644 [Acropora cervicornis]